MSEKYKRRDLLKGIAASTLVLGSGINLSELKEKPGKKSKKILARENAMKTFTKAVWLHINRSFPNGEKDVPFVLDKWADAGFNLLIPHIRSNSGAIYRQTKHPISDLAKDWDPVEALEREAKKRAMRIHPWCSVFVGSGTDFGKAHPEFIGLNNNGENTGNFLCAAREEVQDWAFSFFEELMDNYEVAGIHHDYVRYNDYLCYCDHCKKTFKMETGIDMDAMEKGSAEWARWVTGRVHNINKFVKRVQDAATIKDKETSAAVFAGYPGCVVSVAQDWITWAEEEWVDFLLPMNYWGDVAKFNRLADIHVRSGKSKIPVIEGIANRLPDEVFKIDLTPEQLLDRSRYVKNMGFQGICYFAAGSLTDEDLKVIKTL
ncbi:MAG TPA: family 10 glycosylhydrolase [Cyclobacteriaceae bacterium]|nr:family 10 glycosylhydrolase [Cyclobacteriaceae bacterium]